MVTKNLFLLKRTLQKQLKCAIKSSLNYQVFKINFKYIEKQVQSLKLKTKIYILLEQISDSTFSN